MPTRVKIVMMMAMTLRRLQATGQGRGIANDAPAVLIHIDKHAFSSFFRSEERRVGKECW